MGHNEKMLWNQSKIKTEWETQHENIEGGSATAEAPWGLQILTSVEDVYNSFEFPWLAQDTW